MSAPEQNDNIIRVYDRVYVSPQDLKGLLRAYVDFYDARATTYFTMPAMDMNVVGLESATVNFSVVSAPEEHLARFRETGQTILVRDLDLALRRIELLGGRITQPRSPVPTGFQARGQLSGAPVIEFVEWTVPEDPQGVDLAALGLL